MYMFSPSTERWLFAFARAGLSCLTSMTTFHGFYSPGLRRPSLWISQAWRWPVCRQEPACTRPSECCSRSWRRRTQFPEWCEWWRTRPATKRSSCTTPEQKCSLQGGKKLFLVKVKQWLDKWEWKRNQRSRSFEKRGNSRCSPQRTGDKEETKRKREATTTTKLKSGQNKVKQTFKTSKTSTICSKIEEDSHSPLFRSWNIRTDQTRSRQSGSRESACRSLISKEKVSTIDGVWDYKYESGTGTMFNLRAPILDLWLEKHKKSDFCNSEFIWITKFQF